MDAESTKNADNDKKVVNSVITVDLYSDIHNNVLTAYRSHWRRYIEKTLPKVEEWPKAIDSIVSSGYELEISSDTQNISNKDWEKLFKLLNNKGFRMIMSEEGVITFKLAANLMPKNM